MLLFVKTRFACFWKAKKERRRLFNTKFRSFCNFTGKLFFVVNLGVLEKLSVLKSANA